MVHKSDRPFNGNPPRGAAGRAIYAAALLLALLAGCTHEAHLPDTAVETRTDRRGEIIIKGWEAQIGHLAKEGCAFNGLQIVCNW
jgi:hypothetical protein